jgi:hypothetical protein
MLVRASSVQLIHDDFIECVALHGYLLAERVLTSCAFIPERSGSTFADEESRAAPQVLIPTSS